MLAKSIAPVMKKASMLPNLSCGIAHYRGALRHVAGDYRAGTDHNIIADNYARQPDRLPPIQTS
jgi:hypothetical protein